MAGRGRGAGGNPNRGSGRGGRGGHAHHQPQRQGQTVSLNVLNQTQNTQLHISLDSSGSTNQPVPGPTLPLCRYDGKVPNCWFRHCKFRHTSPLCKWPETCRNSNCPRRHYSQPGLVLGDNNQPDESDNNANLKSSNPSAIKFRAWTGNFAQFKTDALISLTEGNLLNGSLVAKEIAQRAGQSYRKKLEQSRFVDRFTMTEAGDLQCNTIAHVFIGGGPEKLVFKPFEIRRKFEPGGQLDLITPGAIESNCPLGSSFLLAEVLTNLTAAIQALDSMPDVQMIGFPILATSKTDDKHLVTRFAENLSKCFSSLQNITKIKKITFLFVPAASDIREIYAKIFGFSTLDKPPANSKDNNPPQTQGHPPKIKGKPAPMLPAPEMPVPKSKLSFKVTAWTGELVDIKADAIVSTTDGDLLEGTSSSQAIAARADMP